MSLTRRVADMSGEPSLGPWAFDPDKTEIIDSSRHTVAKITIDAEFGVTGGTAMANARLISAAPELLEALEGAILRAERGMPIPDHLMQAAYAAVAKAKGEQS